MNSRRPRNKYGNFHENLSERICTLIVDSLGLDGLRKLIVIPRGTRRKVFLTTRIGCADKNESKRRNNIFSSEASFCRKSSLKFRGVHE